MLSCGSLGPLALSGDAMAWGTWGFLRGTARCPDPWAGGGRTPGWGMPRGRGEAPSSTSCSEAAGEGTAGDNRRVSGSGWAGCRRRCQAALEQSTRGGDGARSAGAVGGRGHGYSGCWQGSPPRWPSGERGGAAAAPAAPEPPRVTRRGQKRGHESRWRGGCGEEESTAPSAAGGAWGQGPGAGRQREVVRGQRDHPPSPRRKVSPLPPPRSQPGTSPHRRRSVPHAAGAAPCHPGREQ